MAEGNVDDHVVTGRNGISVAARGGRPVTTGGDNAAGDAGGPADPGGPSARARRRGDAFRRARDLPGEIPYEVVGRVAAVGRLLQEGDVDETVERGLGTALVGAGEAGDEGGSVDGQVERADPAQGERRVPVGLTLGGAQCVVGDGE